MHNMRIQLPNSNNIPKEGFGMSTKVQDVIFNGSWKWPNEWLLKYPSLYTLTVPTPVPNSLDRLIWKSLNDVDFGFSVTTVWECIRPRGDETDWYNLVWNQLQSYTGVPNMPSSLDLIVDFLNPETRRRSARSVIVKLVFWWLSSDPMARGSVYDFGYVIRVECQARAILFFLSPRCGLAVVILVP
ncbi:hypothetical protein Tco_1320347 [Tanacetum coccineum]